LSGFCTACASPAISDDGRVLACNGPAYFEPPSSPLVVGSLRDRTMTDLVARHRQDVILDTIRTTGPTGLRATLEQVPGFDAARFRQPYRGICELCQEITRDGEAVAALRSALARPEAAAARLATWQVISGHRRRGSLSFSHVNGAGACRVFLRALTNPGQPFDDEAIHVLGRADLDWRRLTDYLAGSGLAAPLTAVLDQPALTRWAPEFFRAGIRARGLNAGVREAVQRDVLERVADAVAAVGGCGVLLKGAVHLLRPPRGLTVRATSDIDVWVEAARAPALYGALIARGFTERAPASPGATHHLAPLDCRGVLVEIHTRLMEAPWGLPEAEMIADARPLAGHPSLRALGPEAFVLHAVVHASTSFYSFGLKTAWDVLAAQRLGDTFDWAKLGAWTDRLPAPRAFWSTMQPLAESLDLGVPPDFLRRAPADPGARRAEFIGRSRLFSATERMYDLDAITKTGMLWMLHSRWWRRAGLLGLRLGAYARRPAAVGDVAARARRTDLGRQAWRRYQQYRRARAREMPLVDTRE
jgi:hypothetical protein